MHSVSHQVITDEVEGTLHYIGVVIDEGGKVIFEDWATVLHNHSPLLEALDDYPLSDRGTPRVLALELHNKWTKMASFDHGFYNVQHMGSTCWDVCEVG